MKRVRFDDNCDSYYTYLDYPKYREKYWELFFIDQMHFKRRIFYIERRIGYIFDLKHRKKLIKVIEQMRIDEDESYIEKIFECPAIHSEH